MLTCISRCSGTELSGGTQYFNSWYPEKDHPIPPAQSGPKHSSGDCRARTAMNMVSIRKGTWSITIWSPLGVKRHSHRGRAEADEDRAGVTVPPRGPAPPQQSTGKNHTSLGKSCHPQRAISHLLSHPTHTPALCFGFYFFFHFSHIFKTIQAVLPWFITTQIDVKHLHYVGYLFKSTCKTFTLL